MGGDILLVSYLALKLVDSYSFLDISGCFSSALGCSSMFSGGEGLRGCL